MKRVAIGLIVVSMVMIPAAAGAQAGTIGTFADQFGTDCNVTDLPGVVTVWVVHANTPGATAAQFKVVDQGHTMIWLADSYPFPIIIGNSHNGISIAYGACLAGPIPLFSMTYFGTGTSSPCTYIDVVGDPASLSGEVEGYDCASNVVYPAGLRGCVNTPNCCLIGGGDCPVPVRETSWGKLKSLYVD